MTAPGHRIAVVLPTYNEAPTIEAVLRSLAEVLPEANLLVVDDASPDGTAAVVESLADSGLRCSVLCREAKLGLGSAYVAGFKATLATDVDVVIQLDADGSHDPHDAARLLDALSDADLAIGSRYVPGGGAVGWSPLRRALSRAGGVYARSLLQLPVEDITSGFRAWRAATLRDVLSDSPSARGYAFQIETAAAAVDLGARLVEVPIQFHEREAGRSKMSLAIMLEALTLVPRLALRSALRRSRPHSEPVAPGGPPAGA